MVSWRRLGGSLGAVAAVMLAATALEVSAARGAAHDITFTLEKAPACAPQHVPLGSACVDKSGVILGDKWEIGATAARWSVAGQFELAYEWTAPATIPLRGGTLTMKLRGSELIGGPGNRICPAMGARGGFDMGAGQPVTIGFCAEAGGTKTESKTIKLVPSAASPVGSIAYLTIGLQDGPVLTYVYRAGTASASVTKKPGAGCRRPAGVGSAGAHTGSCTQGQTFANGCTARIGKDDKEYRAFVGLDDPTKPEYVAWLEPTLKAYIERIPAFPGVTSRPRVFPGESSFGLGVHSDDLVNPGSDIRLLFGHSEPPDELLKGGNVFVKATQQTEKRLLARITASAGNLSPADLVVLALQVTDGHYPLAVLTAHNLLKNLTIKAREALVVAGKAFGTPSYAKRCAQARLALENANAVASKLESLRQNPAAKADKMGPWYHSLAVLAIGALTNSDGAVIAQQAEQQNKRLGLFGGEARYDPEKNNLDFCWSQVAAQPPIDDLARSVIPSGLPRSLEACLALFGAR